jgi:hypothetical protein
MPLNADRSLQTADRRRRLIVVDEESSPTSILAEYGIVPQSADVATPPIAQSGDRLIRRVISQKLWKHLLVLTVISVLVSTASAVSLTAEAADDRVTFERIAHTGAGLQLLLAGQLALLIGWIRGRSQVDFRGRYRSWRWLGIFLLCSSFMTLSGIESLIPEAIAASLRPMMGQIAAARPALMVVPVSAVMVYLLSRVVPDSGRNRASQLLLLLAAVPALCYVLSVQFGTGVLELPVQATHVLALASHIVFSGLLLHARFVAWVCNDPPVIVPVSPQPQSQPVIADSVTEDPARQLLTSTTETSSSEAEEDTASTQGVSQPELKAQPRSKNVTQQQQPSIAEQAADDGLERDVNANDDGRPAQRRKSSNGKRRGKKYRKAG